MRVNRAINLPNVPSTEWVFWHEPSDTVLLFPLLDDENTARPVRKADLASTETHLRGRGLIDRSLAELLGGIALKSRVACASEEK